MRELIVGLICYDYRELYSVHHLYKILIFSVKKLKEYVYFGLRNLFEICI